MDKSTKIAVLLIALILGGNLVYTSQYQKKKIRERQAQAQLEQPTPAEVSPAPPADAAQVQTQEPTPPAGGLAPGDSGRVGPFPRARGDEADFVIETPLQRITLARAGGIVRQVSLSGYEIIGTDLPVALVPPGHAATPGRQALGVVLRSGASAWDLSAARFEVRSGSVDPGPGLQVQAGSGPQSIDLRCEAAGGGAVVKRLTVDPERYDFRLELLLEPGPGLPKVDSYVLDWTTGMPVTEDNAKEDEARFRASAAIGDQIHRKRPGDFRRDEPFAAPGALRWACIQSKYFMVALCPDAPLDGTFEAVGNSKSHWIGMRIQQPSPWRTAGGEAYRVYAGPISYDRIKSLGIGLDAAVELGWSWIRPISHVLLHFMQFLNRFIPNYGIIIIIVSALAKLVFWPLTDRSMRSMRRMQELQPRMEEIRRRYASDPKEMNQQIMHMYREQKVNPVGGCMPILVQTPMFFALFAVLQSNIELRDAPFFSWISNLAGPDVVFRLSTALPVIGSNVSLLPLLMGGTMIWQSAISPATPTPGRGSGPNPMAQQQFLMKWIMPIMMTFIFYKMPSGLVLYWIVNTLMGIAQQLQINRKHGPLPVLAVAPATDGKAKDGRPDRNDGAQRGGRAAERPGRIGRSAS